MLYRSPPAPGGLFGDRTPNLKRETFSAGPSTSTPQSATYLDAIQEYTENHSAFASEGISLLDRVVDFSINSPADVVVPNDAALAAVKKRSDVLAEKWASGKVANPFV